MNRSFKAEGVILKRRDFGEADRLLTVFSLQQGKITVLAKGVRRITSRRAGNVELLNRVVMFLHQAKSFLILTEASAVATFPEIKADLTLSTYAYHVIELVDKLMAENQHDPYVYHNLVSSLTLLNSYPRQIFIRAFEAKLLNHLGFMDLASPKLADNLPGVNPKIVELVQQITVGSWEQVEKLEMNANEALELEGVLRYHMERIIEGSLKSRQFLRKV